MARVTRLRSKGVGMTHVDPAKVKLYQDFGSGNMGSAADDESIAARFGITPGRWMLLFIRIHFTGPASGTADVDIVLRSARGDTWNVKLYTVEARGKGADMNFRVPAEEMPHWLFEGDDELVLEWTNPDVVNDLQWGLTAAMVPVE